MISLLPWLAAPLDPTPDQAREWLRQELLKPQYHRTNPIEQLLGWISDLMNRVSERTSSLSPATQGLILVVFAVFAVGLIWVLSRWRLARRTKSAAAPVFDEPGLRASELRARAEAAIAEGRFEAAVIDGFRALALRQVERRRLDDAPGLTAHEVADALDATYPDLRADIDGAALLFDRVRYGQRRASSDQAASVLALDDRLTGARR